MRRLALLVLVVVAGCRKGGGAVDAGAPVDADWLAGRIVDPPGAPVKGGTLTVRVPIEPVGLTRLHDRFAEGTMTRLTVGPIYETLAKLDDGKLTSQLASGWQLSPNQLKLNIWVRRNVKFHDGTELTAADVKATLDAVRNPKNPTSTLRAALGDLESIEVVDRDQLEVQWRSFSFLCLPTLLAGVPVMPASALEGDFETLPAHRAPNGTGPFRFVSWEAGTAITLARNEGYWGTPAHLDRVVYRFVKDDTAAVAGWERGDFDLVLRIPPAAWRASDTNATLRASSQRILFPENAYAWLGFNQRKPLFADVRVRRALGLLFPAELVERTVDLGLEPRTTCPWLPGSASCDPGVRPLPFSPPEAKQLLADAGWRDSDGDGVLDHEGQRFSFAFLAAAQSQKMARLLPLYLDTLKAAGIDARIETVDVSAYMGRVRAHDFDAMALSWSTQDTLQDNFQNFHSSQRDEGSNYVGYADPEVDGWLEAIRVELDPKKRAVLERAVHRRVYDDQAYLFLGRRPALDAAKRRVRGLKPSLGWYDLAAVWLAD